MANTNKFLPLRYRIRLWLIERFAPGYWDLIAACDNFVKKVETGKAKSRESYGQMLAALKKSRWRK